MTVDRRRPLAPGIYDAPITRALDSALAALADELRETEPLDPSDSPRALARLLHARLVHALASFSGKNEERLAHQVELTNRLLALLEGVKDAGASAEDRLVPPRPGTGSSPQRLEITSILRAPARS